MKSLEMLEHEIQVARESIKDSLDRISPYADLFEADNYNYRNVPGLLTECRELERYLLAIQAFSRVHRAEERRKSQGQDTEEVH
jgi:hypothetical protein